ncbi:serine hydroxymethyltransferase [bacterium]|nr:serine hydroxymethyltransferase [bacterium]
MGTIVVKKDLTLWNLIALELQRQEHHLELIASENYADPEVMRLQGTILTNKYAEGYPGKRYYGGCEVVDEIENLAIKRACSLFNCEYANVQPHSGSSANNAVFQALAQPGDTLMGLDLTHGGHLTHGSAVNFSGIYYKSVPYYLNEKGYLDYDHIEKSALEHKPKIIVAGYSAYPRSIDWTRFRAIADKVGAYLVADIAHISGLIATHLHSSPVNLADVVTSTTHKTLRGPRGGLILSNNPEVYKKLNNSIFPGTQGGPLLHVIAAKALCFHLASLQEFSAYQKQVLLNAKTLSHSLIDHGFELISGGTDNHLMLVSLLKQEISGKSAELLLGLADITLNKNTIPQDPRSPFIASGIRIGTPAITTRGMQEKEMKLIATWIAQLIAQPNNQDVINQIKYDVNMLCKQFPVYKSGDLV